LRLLLRDYHGHLYALPCAQDARQCFDEQIETTMPHGGRGQTFTISTDDEPTLRIDVDIDADRAAIRWLPEGSYVTDYEPDTAITVYEPPDIGLVDVSAGLARVTSAVALAAIVEYVGTGQRPTKVHWSYEEQNSS
jgi:hypothetical protein